MSRKIRAEVVIVELAEYGSLGIVVMIDVLVLEMSPLIVTLNE